MKVENQQDRNADRLKGAQMNFYWDDTLSELATHWPEDALPQFTAFFAQALNCEMALLVLPEASSDVHHQVAAHFGVPEDTMDVLRGYRLELIHQDLYCRSIPEGEMTLGQSHKDDELGLLESLFMDYGDLNIIFCQAFSFSVQKQGVLYAGSQHHVQLTPAEVFKAQQLVEWLKQGLNQHHNL